MVKHYTFIFTLIAAQASLLSADQQPSPQIEGRSPQQILALLGAKGRDGVTENKMVMYRRIFGLIDSNGDGQHSKKEFVDDGRYLTRQARQGIFRAADSNGDEIVSKNEYIENRIITDEAKAIFDAMDSNNDHTLTEKEFVASGKLKEKDLAKAVFKAMDSEDDGKLVIPEYLRAWGRWARRRAQRIPSKIVRHARTTLVLQFNDGGPTISKCEFHDSLWLINVISPQKLLTEIFISG